MPTMQHIKATTDQYFFNRLNIHNLACKIVDLPLLSIEINIFIDAKNCIYSGLVFYFEWQGSN